MENQKENIYKNLEEALKKIDEINKDIDASFKKIAIFLISVFAGIVPMFLLGRSPSIEEQILVCIFIFMLYFLIKDLLKKGE